MSLLSLTSLGDQRYKKPRRNTTGGLGNLFKTAIGSAFATFLADSLQPKPTIQQNEQTIKHTIKHINDIIDTVDDHITRRMQVHQQQLFGIVRDEVQDMKKETQRAVESLNEKITEKNVDSQVWKLNNQLDYFKNQSYALFQENRRNRVQIRLLRKKIVDGEIDREGLDGLLQKMRRKELKRSFQQKRSKSKGKGKDREEKGYRSERYQDVSGIGGAEKVGQDERARATLKQFKDKIDEQQQSMIAINVLENSPRDMNPANFQFDEKSQGKSVSLPSLSILSQHTEQAPKMVLQQADSYLMQSPVNQSSAVKVDKSTQTDPVLISDIKKNAFKVSKQKTMLVYRTHQNRQRCKTDQDVHLSVKKSQGEKHLVRKEEWLCAPQRNQMRLVNKSVRRSKKEARSMLYMSTALGRNKMQMAQTGGPFRSGRS